MRRVLSKTGGESTETYQTEEVSIDSIIAESEAKITAARARSRERASGRASMRAQVAVDALYKSAREAWRTNTIVRVQSHGLGWSERDYCDRYLHEKLKQKTLEEYANEPGSQITVDYDAAYEKAGG